MSTDGKNWEPASLRQLLEDGVNRFSSVTEEEESCGAIPSLDTAQVRGDESHPTTPKHEMVTWVTGCRGAAPNTETLIPWRGDSPMSQVQRRGSMGYPFSSLGWYYWQNDPVLSGAHRKPDEREYGDDEEGFGGITGKIVLCFCAGILIICLVCCAQILQKVQGKRLYSDKRESNSKVPRNPIRRYYSRVSTWLFLSTIFSGTNKKCIQQPSGSTCRSGTTAAGCSHNRRQERWFPKLSQETARRRYSFNVDNNSSNIWAPLQKANKMEAIPREARRRQSPAQEQRDPESYWIREQPCGHCKAERTQQWLFQHFFKPVTPPPEQDTSIEEDV